MRCVWKFIFFLILSSVFAVAAAEQSWSSWVQQLRSESIAQGIRPEVFDQAFAGIHEPSKAVVRFDRTQPEKRLTFLEYRDTRADAYRIKIGRSAMQKNYVLLDQVSARYGVSPCYIASFWGLETSYGNYKGSFPVIKSLATLAFDGRRSQIFRKQLMYALHILNEGHISLADFKGEWAGASGHPQFLPSSWYYYAVDADGDGKRDIWNNKADAFSSIANYLVQHNWVSAQPWGMVVTLPPNFNNALIANKEKKTVADWVAMGVTFHSNYAIDPKWDASIIHPYGGPDLMVFNNFFVIMRWNRSNYYAGTVGYLADKLCYN